MTAVVIHFDQKTGGYKPDFLNAQVMLSFESLERLLLGDSKHFFFLLSMKPWLHNDLLVDLNRPKATAAFHEIFKYPALLIASGGTAIGGRKLPQTSIRCVCRLFAPVCSCE